MAKTELDGEIYLSLEDIPQEQQEEPREGEVIWDSDESHPNDIDFENKSVSNVYTRRIAKWVDPTTLPKIRNKCVKWFRYPGGKTCTGWKLEKKWYYRRATLIVTVAEPFDVADIVNDCIKTTAVATAIIAIVTGGFAAAAAVEKLMFACLKVKLASKLVSVSINLNGAWGGWE